METACRSPGHARKVALRFRIERLQAHFVGVHAHKSLFEIVFLLRQCPGLVRDLVAFDDARPGGLREQSAELRRPRLRGMRLNIPVALIYGLPKAVQIRIAVPGRRGAL